MKQRKKKIVLQTLSLGIAAIMGLTGLTGCKSKSSNQYDFGNSNSSSFSDNINSVNLNNIDLFRESIASSIYDFIEKNPYFTKEEVESFVIIANKLDDKGMIKIFGDYAKNFDTDTITVNFQNFAEKALQLFTMTKASIGFENLIFAIDELDNENIKTVKENIENYDKSNVEYNNMKIKTRKDKAKKIKDTFYSNYAKFNSKTPTKEEMQEILIALGIDIKAYTFNWGNSEVKFTKSEGNMYDAIYQKALKSTADDLRESVETIWNASATIDELNESQNNYTYNIEYMYSFTSTKSYQEIIEAKMKLLPNYPNYIQKIKFVYGSNGNGQIPLFVFDKAIGQWYAYTETTGRWVEKSFSELTPSQQRSALKQEEAIDDQYDAINDERAALANAGRKAHDDMLRYLTDRMYNGISDDALMKLYDEKLKELLKGVTDPDYIKKIKEKAKMAYDDAKIDYYSDSSLSNSSSRVTSSGSSSSSSSSSNASSSSNSSSSDSSSDSSSSDNDSSEPDLFEGEPIIWSSTAQSESTENTSIEEAIASISSTASAITMLNNVKSWLLNNNLNYGSPRIK